MSSTNENNEAVEAMCNRLAVYAEMAASRMQVAQDHSEKSYQRDMQSRFAETSLHRVGPKGCVVCLCEQPVPCQDLVVEHRLAVGLFGELTDDTSGAPGPNSG